MRRSHVDTESDDDVEHEIEERRIIEAAMARGYAATRWMAFALALLFIASGLWWAGLLVVVLTSFEVPRFVTQRYARKRGVELRVPSAQTTEKTSLSGLAIAAVFIPAVCGLVVADATLGHPLLPWSWKSKQWEVSGLYMVIPIAFVALVSTITWFVRRQRAARISRE